MSERLFKFLLSEVKSIRVVCPRPQCSAKVEVSVEQFASRFGRQTPACPVCNHDFYGLSVPDGERFNAFTRLANAILEFQGSGRENPPEVKIEFLLPDPTP